MAIVSGSCGSVNAANGPSFTATPGSGLGSHSQPMVVVWEWQDDQGHWRPYSGQVSAYIERCVCPPLTGAGLTNICLGHSDPRLAHYLIDIPGRKQFRQDTGKTRSVRRSLFAQSSGLGSGVFWEWANDEGTWTPYETRTSILLEHSYHARQGTADLASHGYNYIVDLTSLTQVNKSTGFRRQVRRQCNLPYPLAPSGVSSGVSSGASSGASGSSTGAPPGHTSASSGLSSGVPGLSSGPSSGVSALSSGISSGAPSRLSSVSSGPVSLVTGAPGNPSSMACSCQQCSSGRTTAAHPTSVYSPYPRRPLSVGSVSWGSPWLPPTAAGHPSLPHPHSSSSGMSVPSVSVHLNGSNSVSSALAGMASILMSAVGLGVHFHGAALPQQPPPPPAALQPVPVPPAARPHTSSSVRSTKRQLRRACGQRPEEVIQRYMEVVVGVPDEDCIICMDQLSNPSTYEAAAKEERSPVIEAAAVGKFIKCGHTLHMLCMLAMYNNGTKDGSLQCPSCKTIYGEKTGTQPKGKMEIYSISQSLPGHPDCGTIQIIYSIPPGIQSPEHPNPGQPYSCRGFPRFCFLPDNGKGRKVLELLKVAWMRRLIFTVGTSSTTGEPDTVVWNGIHHKTEMMSNLSGHGYPDPNYLDNVLSELASQGITEDLLQAHS
uniref:E3 ubiquitin-protein ligase n=1 Tax=Knipowitschia caucasica TaxID=637954 RepID=A0AAV2J588_KNICA